MQQPEGFEIKGKQHLDCKLIKSIYGFKQPRHCWNVTLDTHLKEIGLLNQVVSTRIQKEKNSTLE